VPKNAVALGGEGCDWGTTLVTYTPRRVIPYPGHGQVSREEKSGCEVSSSVGKGEVDEYNRGAQRPAASQISIIHTT